MSLICLMFELFTFKGASLKARIGTIQQFLKKTNVNKNKIIVILGELAMHEIEPFIKLIAENGISKYETQDL